MSIFMKRFLRNNKEIYSNGIDRFSGVFAKYVFETSNVSCLLLVSENKLLVVFYTKFLFRLSPFSMSEISLNDVANLSIKVVDNKQFVNILLTNDNTLSFLIDIKKSNDDTETKIVINFLNLLEKKG